MNMHSPDPLTRRLIALVEENETLREEVRQLRDLLCPPNRVPREWRLTGSEERLLSTLCAAGTRTVNRERAVVAMCMREDDLPESYSLLSVHVSRIRRKLARVGLPTMIEVDWGKGYRLTPEGLLALNAALSAETHRLTTLAARAGEDGGREA